MPTKAFHPIGITVVWTEFKMNGKSPEETTFTDLSCMKMLFFSRQSVVSVSSKPSSEALESLNDNRYTYKLLWQSDYQGKNVVTLQLYWWYHQTHVMPKRRAESLRKHSNDVQANNILAKESAKKIQRKDIINNFSFISLVSLNFDEIPFKWHLFW